ncbi:MAG TPA: ribulose-phosphate 3-epimerase [Bacilli bacterium]|nr:ribulose-phosphate 3-epimerase [Bacilli bacterium]
MKEVSGSFLSNNDKFYEINRLNNSNVDYIHFDVMDGKFVSNKNITVSELPKLIDNVKKKIDIHFMVSNPDKYIEKICYYNIEYITIHYEIKNLEDYIDKIKNYGFKVGIAIKPETDIEKIYYLLDKINLVLIMSVEPGKSGQKFIDVSDKINKLKQEIINRKLNIKISVDGGINEEVLTYVKEADILVSSSFILSDLDKNVDMLKNS